MTIDYETMNETLKEAERTMNVVDSVATRIACLLVGRLRKVSGSHTLRALKKELAQYNMVTGRWAP